MTLEKKIIVKNLDQAERLDIFLSEKTKTSRSQIQKQIKDKQIFINNKAIKKTGAKVRNGDEITINKIKIQKDTEKIETTPEKNNLKKIKIIKDGPDYIVLEKPSGILMHPTEAHEKNTLSDWLVKKYPQIKKVGDNPEQRPGIVHRLDKEASGLIVVAKTQQMFEHLKKQFQNREVEKIYSVLVFGNIDKDNTIIDFDIDRGSDGKMVARPKTDKMKLKNIKKIQTGKTATTEIWKEKEYSRFTLLRVKIHTGRTHQIRVHMLAYGHPVVGDKLYYNKNLYKRNDILLDRLFLHAKKLCFTDLKNKQQSFEIDLPKKLKSYLENLK